jgi:hypothetical protein
LHLRLAAHLAPWDWLEKKKGLKLFRANWKSWMTGRRSGVRWTPVNARDRDGPATLGSHGGGATRRFVTGS